VKLRHVLLTLGVFHILTHKAIVEAVSPLYALKLVAHAPGTAFVVLGCRATRFDYFDLG
jgi:K+ transporter